MAYIPQCDVPVSVPSVFNIDQATGSLVSQPGEGILSYAAVLRCVWGLDSKTGKVTTSPVKVQVTGVYRRGPAVLKKDGTPRKVRATWRFAPGEACTFAVPSEGDLVLGTALKRWPVGAAIRTLLDQVIALGEVADLATCRPLLAAQIQAHHNDVVALMAKAKAK